MARKRVVKKRTVSKKRTRRKQPRKRKAVKRRASTKRRVVKRKAPRKKVRSQKKSPSRKKVKRKTAAPTKLLKQVSRISVERTVAGKRRRRRRSVPKQKSRRRAVSGRGGSGLLIGLAIGVGAYILLSGMSKTPATTNTSQYGTLNQTANATRNSKSQDILNYAIAAGLAANLIGDLIDRLNSSSDSDIKNIYDHVNTTGDVGSLVYA